LTGYFRRVVVGAEKWGPAGATNVRERRLCSQGLCARNAADLNKEGKFAIIAVPSRHLIMLYAHGQRLISLFAKRFSN
jgi:hypothetical protein